MRNESQVRAIAISEPVQAPSTIDAVIEEIYVLLQEIKKHKDNLKKNNIL